jgi:hypothetical protein
VFSSITSSRTGAFHHSTLMNDALPPDAGYATVSLTQWNWWQCMIFMG